MKKLPQYYKVVRAFLKNGTSVLVWRASDGETNIYTIYKTDITLSESEIVDWTDWEE